MLVHVTDLPIGFVPTDSDGLWVVAHHVVHRARSPQPLGVHVCVETRQLERVADDQHPPTLQEVGRHESCLQLVRLHVPMHVPGGQRDL